MIRTATRLTLGITVILLAFIFSPRSLDITTPVASSLRSFLHKHIQLAAPSLDIIMTIAPVATEHNGHKRGEVYFLSHGGPNSAFETESKPYAAWKKYGDYIRALDPKGLVVVSAHWDNPSGSPDVISECYR